MPRLPGAIDLDASNFSALVDRLVGRGALEAHTDPTDRPVRALVLTPEGERLRHDFWHHLLTDPGPVAPLPQDDLRTLTRLLAKLDQPTD